VLKFDNSYRRLPSQFYSEVLPQRIPTPQLVVINEILAQRLGFESLQLTAQAAAIFSGNAILPGAQPLAAAYAGHQFGQFVPQLGDGRAILLGEVLDSTGQRFDLQLKGSGRTPYSRGGDGKAPLGPVLREYIVSEYMHAVGVPTTRALAAVTTGETVLRDEALPGAILTRIASSHIRVGTFQYFAARGDVAALKLLADHVIARHYPELEAGNECYVGLLRAVVTRQASLIAKWLQLGFIHGVMNTDNMTVSGETIDYGPCAFMETYNPAAVFSAIDRHGRYAFANQPLIAQWNLARFGETLLPLFKLDEASAVKVATEIITEFPGIFSQYWLTGMRAKLGLQSARTEDETLIAQLLEIMHLGDADFTLTFRYLSRCETQANACEQLFGLFKDTSKITDWLVQWQQRLQHEAGSADQRMIFMLQHNPAFIPRNHRVQQVLDAAIRQGDFKPFQRLCTILKTPCADQLQFAAYMQPAGASERIHQTFCGT
jgi:serine/tyrosine/threonine adenylyltransferase